ncbi:hypothetical protein [Acinetobacter sp. ANC 4173]|uniref:hypothetical protein n=1 Tax=Acinetobacter sp. ANC 4173 TaxID=2529837 RepID=UPI001038F2A9|nr:hypothetical protein E0H94_17940 [Acinetobacter sp. ANC 4173]
MKKLVLVVFCALSSLSLQAQEEPLTSTQKEQPTIYELTDSNSTTLLMNRTSKYTHLKVDKKTYYSDDAIEADLKKWWVTCYKKPFDNKKVCSMHSGDLSVFLINGKYSVDVGNDHYPNTKAGLRIDNGSAIYGYEGEIPNPLNVIEKLKKGKTAYTRYQEWPYTYDVDNEIDLSRFSEHFNKMLKQYKEL